MSYRYLHECVGKEGIITQSTMLSEAVHRKIDYSYLVRKCLCQIIFLSVHYCIC